MLTDRFISNPAISRYLRDTTYVDAQEYALWLSTRGYTPATITSYLRAAVLFLTWAEAQSDTTALLLDGVSISKYRGHVNRGRAGKFRDRSNLYCGARRLLVFLQEKGIYSEPTNTDPVLLCEFGSWMRDNRRSAESTLASYYKTLRPLLQALGDDPSLYNATQLRLFVLGRSQGFSHSHTESVVTAVRMFVRFLVATKRCSSALNHAIPRLAKWQKASQPKYLNADQIEKIICTCDPDTIIGSRDNAILLLLARLALRAGDIAGLQLDDIDWKQSRLSVCGKSYRQAWLPLPQDAGDALLHYLNTARPSVTHRAVFCIATAPYTPMHGHTVSHMAGRHIRQSGVDAPSHGAHLFRHSAATMMLRQGMSLESIGTVLRHQDVDTTTIYAKVDTELLQQITLPWIEETLPC